MKAKKGNPSEENAFEIDGGTLLRYSGSAENVILPDGVAAIADMAFLHRDEIRSVTFPQGLERVNMAAFFGCKRLKKVRLPDTVKSIGPFAFGDCLSLEEIILPDGLEFLAAEAFYGTAFYECKENWENGALYSGKHLIEAKELSGTYTVKDGTLTVSSGAFESCKSLKSVRLPSSLARICFLAFGGCESLENAEYADNCRAVSVDEYAFSGCEKLMRACLERGDCAYCGGRSNGKASCPVCGRKIGGHPVNIVKTEEELDRRERNS